MADVVDAMPRGKGGHQPYPSQWFDGRVWKIAPGVDAAAATAHTLQRGLYQAARTRGFLATTRVRDGHVYFQARGRP